MFNEAYLSSGSGEYSAGEHGDDFSNLAHQSPLL